MSGLLILSLTFLTDRSALNEWATCIFPQVPKFWHFRSFDVTKIRYYATVMILTEFEFDFDDIEIFPGFWNFLLQKFCIIHLSRFRAQFFILRINFDFKLYVDFEVTFWFRGHVSIFWHNISINFTFQNTFAFPKHMLI